jgi:hypothetical protein
MSSKTWAFDTKGALETKHRNLQFLLPKEAKDGGSPMRTTHFKGSLPDGVVASWRTEANGVEIATGERLCGDYYIPAPRAALMPGESFSLTITTAQDADLEAPILVAHIASQQFFYRPSAIEIPLPAGVANANLSPQEMMLLRAQMEAMNRPRRMEDLDTSRVEVVDESTTLGDFMRLQQRLGAPASGEIEVFVSAEGRGGRSTSSLILTA